MEMDIVEEHGEHQDSNNSSDKNIPFEYSSEDTVITDQTDEDVVTRDQFDGDGDEDVDTVDIQLKIDNENDDQNEVYSDEYSDYDDSLDEDMESEIDLLLEQGLPKSKRLDLQGKGRDNCRTGKESGKPNHIHEPTIRKIVVLEEKGGNTFEVLPGGWIQVRHSSGMPLYLHRKSRVCSLAKPYYIGPASVRRHSIPLSGIPCLAYRKALDKEKIEKETLEENEPELEKESEQLIKSPEKPPCNTNETLEIQKEAVKKKTKLKFGSLEERMRRFKRKLDIDKVCPMDESEINITCISSDTNCSENLPEMETVVESVQSPVCATVNEDITMESQESSGENQSESADNNNEAVEIMEDEVEITQCGQPKRLKKTIIMANPFKNTNDKRGDKTLPGVKTLIPLAKVETARENASLYSVTPLDLREYCQPLFKFAEVECKRFKTWSARRRHTKEQKRRQLERPTLPDNAQVIKFFDLNASKSGEEQMVKKFNDYVFNPNGKSSVCILHEFVQHALRKQPTYSFQELENAATPYSATVMINEIPYGRGYGSSKKTAKAEAAKATLEILIPQMKGQLNGNKADTNSDFDITEYFQQVEMNDVRIPKMCTSVSEPSPYTLLLTCLQRNFGQSGSSSVKFEMIPSSPSKGNPPNQFRMSAGNDDVVVVASNKREGKQLASQLLLSKIHPHITNFGAFIKMYGNGSIKSVKEKKQEEQQITTLQSKASANSPNWAILNKLRQEMLKLTVPEKDEEKANNSDSNDADAAIMSNSSDPPLVPEPEGNSPDSPNNIQLSQSKDSP